MMVCQRGPGDNEEQENMTKKRRMEERIMNEHNPTDEENQEPALAGSNQQDTGEHSADGEEARIVKRKRTPRRLVERVTALRGLGIAHPRDPKSMLRRQTLVDIKSKDAEIPYVKFETAIRDLVCSLMERQDRMNEEIFIKMNDLGYRVGDIEENHPARGETP